MCHKFYKWCYSYGPDQGFFLFVFLATFLCVTLLAVPFIIYDLVSMMKGK